MKSKLSIKSIFLENVQTNPKEFFYLAPDVVGSVNNAYSSKNKKNFIIDFNTTDKHTMKLVVPHTTYSKHCKSSDNDTTRNFLMKFLDGAEAMESGNNEMLGEMVDEFGNLYGKEDAPANIRGNPGGDQEKDSNFKYQNTNQNTVGMNNASYGFGAVVW